MKLFARVEDNDPAGAKGTESSVVTIHIVSQQEMDRMTLAKEGLEAMESKYAQAARRMEAMADRIEKLKNEIAKLDPDSELAEVKHDELQKLADDLEAAADEVEKSAEHTLPLDLDKALTKELTKAADALRDAAKEVREANKAGLGAGHAGEKLADAAKALGREQDDFKQNASDPLEHLDKIYPLIEDQSRFIDLTAQQRDLAERIAALETKNGQDDPQLKGRMRDLQEQQSQVRNDLRQLLDDIDEHIERLPEDPKVDDLRKTAREFVEAVRKSDAQTEIQKSEEALSDFAGSRAAMAARQAAETLQSFIKKSESIGQQGEQCLIFQPTLASDLGDTIEQLLGSSGLPGMGKTGRGTGGYSARRSSLKNVGLYGRTPVRGKESAAQAGQGMADRGAGTHGDGQPDANANPDGSAKSGVTQATGEGDAAVPQQYKKRVNDYFRRVADELEQ